MCFPIIEPNPLHPIRKGGPGPNTRMPLRRTRKPCETSSMPKGTMTPYRDEKGSEGLTTQMRIIILYFTLVPNEKGAGV
jgi:hypothetical protein